VALTNKGRRNKNENGMSRLVQEAKFKAELKERETARMAALEQEWRKRKKESVRTRLLPTMLL
jgi:hypothetical protein